MQSKAIKLIAPCGMNCRLCVAYQREKNRCPGCRETSINNPKTRFWCKIKRCRKLARGKRWCYQCGEFPCEALRHLDKRYRTKYHMSMTENLQNIKRLGVKKFVENEKARWACAQCGGMVCVHKGCCIACAKIQQQSVEGL